MKIACKPPAVGIEGVFIKEINHPFLDTCMVVARVWSDFGHGDPTLTSAADGKHGVNSYHGKGFAWDWRVWGLSQTEAETVARRIRDELRTINPAFDVVYGDEKHKDHIHVEYDLARAGGVVYG